MLEASGFRVQGSEFKGQAIHVGSKVQGSGPGVQGSELRVIPEVTTILEVAVYLFRSYKGPYRLPPAGGIAGAYRGTLLIGNCPPPWDCHRALVMVLL